MRLKTEIIALVLCASLLLSLFSGCSTKKEEPPAVPMPEQTADITLSEDADRNAAYAAGYGAFSPDEVMLRVSGRDVKWQEFYYWLLVSIEFYIENYGEITDWSAGDGKKSIEEYVIGEAVDIIRLHAAVETKAEELGVSVSESDREYLDSTKENMVQQYGGREAFEAELQKSFMTEELYDRQNEISVLYYNLFTELYGEDGEKADDEAVAEFAESIGYMRMKHIMLYTIDENGTALDEAALAERKSLLEDVLTEILSYPAEEREEVFDGKMNELSEDEGLADYPDGYSFFYGEGELAQELEEAVSALEIGGIGEELAESSQGYHIVMRLPVLPDTPVDEYYTLRYYAAYSEFEALANTWQDETEAEYTDAMKSLSLAEIFPAL